MKRLKGITYYLALTVLIYQVISCKTVSESEPTADILDKTSMAEAIKMQVKVEGEGSPLLLVPGGLTGWIGWEPFVHIFIAKEKKIIRVQLINVAYGFENQSLPSDYSVKMESQALAAALDSLVYDSPIDVVGWSFGALVLLDYALSYPERIRTMTLIEPPAFWVLQERKLIDDEIQKTINFHNQFMGDITEEMLAAFLRDAGVLREGQSAQEHPMWPQWIDYRQSLQNLPAIYAQRDDLNRLMAFNLPVMLVKGSGSSPNLHLIVDELASHLPDANLIEMPGGHLPHIVSMDSFLTALENFQNVEQ
ncbi:pimeloyl-ACP methyl ester carboxylesterase [Catalinimonas alkaloidigena]|uniref:alpha/beta fold hydrolase n=1 Tax=Catalinimonas alkaloidigena TaxID=1075417 RepID=UPI002405E250|nr:alpha/beta hydrolase [Catalinimonas alkaloidigena]MDF9798628.1 pimeloyl-ACP methyl ester carboxylesterase [Catalinimonas alkaloidigena]